MFTHIYYIFIIYILYIIYLYIYFFYYFLVADLLKVNKTSLGEALTTNSSITAG